MLKTKAQGGMEYMLTYLWAILVVTIVGIVLWHMGVLSSSGPEVTSSGFPKVKPEIETCKMSTSGDFSCLFGNGLGSSITLDNIYLSSDSATCIVTAPSLGTSVGVGEHFMLQATGCPTGAVNQAYVVEVSISYTLSVGGGLVTHNDTGVINGPHEAP
jgi:hypothetical protein